MPKTSDYEELERLSCQMKVLIDVMGGGPQKPLIKFNDYKQFRWDSLSPGTNRDYVEAFCLSISHSAGRVYLPVQTGTTLKQGFFIDLDFFPRLSPGTNRDYVEADQT